MERGDSTGWGGGHRAQGGVGGPRGLRYLEMGSLGRDRLQAHG